MYLLLAIIDIVLLNYLVLFANCIEKVNEINQSPMKFMNTYEMGIPNRIEFLAKQNLLENQRRNRTKSKPRKTTMELNQNRFAQEFDSFQKSPTLWDWRTWQKQSSRRKINKIDKKGNSLFSSWSRWSKCSKNCQQSRHRRCRFLHICGRAVMRERKPCWEDKCQKSQVEVYTPVPNFQTPAHTSISRPQVRVLLNYNTLFYSDWSQWTHCSETCLTIRERYCQHTYVCGNTVIREEAYCYLPRSACAKWFTRPKINKHVPNMLPNVTSTNESDVTTTTLTTPQILANDLAFKPPSNIQRGNKIAGKKSNSMFLDVRRNRFQNYFKNQKNPSMTDRTARRKQRTKAVSRRLEDLTVGRPHVLPEQCGRNGFSQASKGLRILGGLESAVGKWPWQVAILNANKKLFCGGTLITSQWILTAAHCIKKVLFVRISEHDLGVNEGKEIELKVNKTIVHPLYDPMTVDNDIALLRLPQPLKLGRLVRPICVPRLGSHPPVGTQCTILGWGRKISGIRRGSQVLNEAQVPVVSEEMCKHVYHEYYITHNMFCAGFRKGYIDSCAGDSGGPLLCQDRHQWYIHGVTSFGEGCGRKGKYGIYAKVENYRTWMNDVIGAYTPVQRRKSSKKYKKQRQRRKSKGKKRHHKRKPSARYAGY